MTMEMWMLELMILTSMAPKSSIDRRLAKPTPALSTRSTEHPGRTCTSAVTEARRATLRREATAARATGGGGVDNETCVICAGPVVAPVELPCGHAYCGACLAELRVKKVAQACPLCRAELPPGVDGLFDLAFRTVRRIEGMVERGEVTWTSLPAAEQEEMEQAEAMYTEAAAQGHGRAHNNLGILLHNERKDLNSAEAAYRAAIAADAGYAAAHYNLGTLLHTERKDADGAEAAYRAAIAVDPGHANAHGDLGYLLQNVRQDFDGAEAAYRAAIAADPDHANAHSNLGTLLRQERKDMDGAEAAYRAAIAADPGNAHAHSNLAMLLERRAREIQSGGDLAKTAALCGECARLLVLAKACGLGAHRPTQHETGRRCRAGGRATGAPPPPLTCRAIVTGYMRGF